MPRLTLMGRPILTLALAASTALGILAISPEARAFCGFYVAKADAKLFNEASKVVMMRDGNRTVLTMVNDFIGDPTEFAMVIPAPTVLEREQINVAENGLVEHLDAYTAPRLVEYYDDDPCNMRIMMRSTAAPATMAVQESAGMADKAKARGVTIEAQYTVGEYDILILSAKESDGLELWLKENDYRIPDGAAPVLGSYIKQGMKFFVAKVNLAEKAKLGGEFLRPLQIAYESEKFMLPIRLGTVNARGKQDLILYTLTREGRVETANYRTQRIPADQPVPLFVKSEFPEFYKAMFSETVNKAGGSGVFLEYAWDMSWCDPCAADPLSNEQLRQLGVYWLDQPEVMPQPGIPGQPRLQPMPQPAPNVFVTRLHIRYDAKSFPEDLRFNQTKDRENFQGRYVMTHPFKGEMRCEAGAQYIKSLPQRFEQEAKSLANMTGWDVATIRDKMKANGQDPASWKLSTPPKDDGKWWRDLWGNKPR